MLQPPHTNFFLSTILAFAAAFFSFLGSIFNAVLLASLLLARNERARVIFHLINVNYFLFSQVTTPFILSVCLADFLFAIVVLPTQATRWQVSTAPHNPQTFFFRFMSRDWEVGVGPEDGMTCQVYPIILFTVQVLISHVLAVSLSFLILKSEIYQYSCLWKNWAISTGTTSKLKQSPLTL